MFNLLLLDLISKPGFCKASPLLYGFVYCLCFWSLWFMIVIRQLSDCQPKIDGEIRDSKYFLKVYWEMKVHTYYFWTGWFRSTLGFDLLGFRSILVSICTRYQFQTAHYSIYTNSDLHSFRSALFSLCNFWICKDFALLSIRSAQISICTDFDLHVFRYANQF